MKYYWVQNESNPEFDDWTNSNITISEIKIGWITQANNDTQVTTDNKFIDSSKIKILDLKTNIHKNLSKLIMWQNKSDSEVSSNITLIQNDFNNWFNDWLVLKWWDVIYIKDKDIKIDCWNVCKISWKKTIIVENGNLIINSNMYYENNKSILWIILIWNTSSWDKSQLKISEHITNWVWVVYSEWPVLSVSSNNSNNIYYWGNTSEDDLINQLHWKWSFATRNTVWWSIKALDIKTSCPYWTPDYEKNSCTLEKAQWYDLIYLRRYATEADWVTPINSNSKIAWYWDSNLITAPNNLDAPLIIDYDPNLQNNPPYGFWN